MTDNMLLGRAKNKNEKQPTLLTTPYVTLHAFYILIRDNIHDHLNFHEEETGKTLHIT